MCLFFSGSDDYKYGYLPAPKPRKFSSLCFLSATKMISKSEVSILIGFVFLSFISWFEIPLIMTMFSNAYRLFPRLPCFPALTHLLNDFVPAACFPALVYFPSFVLLSVIGFLHYYGWRYECSFYTSTALNADVFLLNFLIKFF